MKVLFGMKVERALRRLRWAGHAAAEAAEMPARHRAAPGTAAAQHREGRR